MTYEKPAVDHALVVRKLDTALDSLALLRRLMADALVELDAPTPTVALLTSEALKVSIATREAHALLTGKPLVDPRVRIVPTPAQIEARRLGPRLVTMADCFAGAEDLNPDGPDGAA